MFKTKDKKVSNHPIINVYLPKAHIIRKPIILCFSVNFAQPLFFFLLFFFPIPKKGVFLPIDSLIFNRR